MQRGRLRELLPAAAVLALAAGAAGAAQQYRVDVDLDLVEFRVEDDRGNFVGGLQAADFRLLVNGAEVPITTLYEVQPETPVAAPDAQPSEASASDGSRPKEQRRFLFMLDFLYPTRSSVRYSFAGAIYFLENLIRPGDLVGLAVYGRDGFDFPVAFTDRHDRILAMIRSMSPGQFREPDATARTDLDELRAFEAALFGEVSEGDMASRVVSDATESAEDMRSLVPLLDYLESLADLGELLRALPGATHVVLMSRGFVDIALEDRLVFDSFEDAVTSLATSGATVHAIDPAAMEGIRVHDPAFMTSRVDVRNLVDSFQSPFVRRGPLHEIAERTGGTTTWFAHNVNEGLDRMDALSSRYYVLGYRRPADSALAVDVDIQVTATSEGTAVGFPRRLGLMGRYQEWTAGQQRLLAAEALAGGREQTAFPLYAGASVTAVPVASSPENGRRPWATAAVYFGAPGTPLVNLAQQSDPQLELLWLSSDEKGRTVDFIRERVTASEPDGLVYSGELAVPPEGGRITLLAREASTGALTSRVIDVPPAPADGPWLGRPVLLAPIRAGQAYAGRSSYRRTVAGGASDRRVEPLTVGNASVSPASDAAFLSGGSAGFFVGVFGLSSDTATERLSFRLHLRDDSAASRWFSLTRVGHASVPGGIRAVVGFPVPPDVPAGAYAARIVVEIDSEPVASPEFPLRVIRAE